MQVETMPCSLLLLLVCILNHLGLLSSAKLYGSFKSAQVSYPPINIALSVGVNSEKSGRTAGCDRSDALCGSRGEKVPQGLELPELAPR